MTTPAIVPNLTPFQTRHPELVSGSIVPHIRSLGLTQNEAIQLPNNASARAEKWTLKQVQGDGNFVRNSRGSES